MAHESPRLERIGDDLWTVSAPLSFYGLSLGTRMTVCKLDDGSIALISPVPHDEALQADVEALGPVSYLVAPNLWHHLFLGQWMSAMPEAVALGPEGLAQKRPDLQGLQTLRRSARAGLGGGLVEFPIAGMPSLNESLFYHQRSKTLVVTDFCLFLPDARGGTELAARLLGIYARPHTDVLFRALVRDERSFLSSLVALRRLDIERLSMCHHAVVDDARAQIDRILGALGVEEHDVEQGET